MLDAEVQELIKKYFDDVNYMLSIIYTRSPHLYEEDLTVSLGKLLNSGSVEHEGLKYTVSNLNHELRKCGKGGYFKVKFETPEYTKKHENKYFADIGFLIKIKSHRKTIKKAVLVQCKSLKRLKGKFSIESKYDQLIKKKKDKKTQFEKIVECENKYKLDYCYLLYNPLSAAFIDGSTINSFEEKTDVNDLKYSPGIKMIDTNFIANIDSNIPSLKDCYKKSLEYSIGVTFISFSSFILSLFNCSYGDKDNHRLIDIVEGNDEQIGIKVKNRVEIGYFTE